MAVTVDEARTFLRRRNALIVHFSGCPKGVGFDTCYPDDLVQATANPHWGLACSVVKPGDGIGNAFGFVGIIVDVTKDTSVVAVSTDDCGSQVDRGTGKRIALDMIPTAEKCEKSLDERTKHNEWVVEDYEVMGIFVLRPPQIWSGSGLGGPTKITVGDIHATFGKPVVTTDEQGFWRWHSGDRWCRCTHQDVYGW